MSSLEDIKTKVDSRIAELEPLVEEYEQLIAIRNQFANAGKPKPRARVSRAKSKRAPSRRRSGSRAQQSLDLIRTRPGITTQEVASEINISDANYLYRVLPRLENEGQIRREGKGWAAVAD